MELQVIQSKIYGIGGKRVMLDHNLGKTSPLNENDLAGFMELYAARASAYKGH